MFGEPKLFRTELSLGRTTTPPSCLDSESYLRLTMGGAPLASDRQPDAWERGESKLVEVEEDRS